jgi:hypothetical protein
MKFLRYLLFIPICILVISLIYWLFALLLTWFIGLSTFWLIAILIFFGSMIWGIFKMLSALIMGFTSKISPSFEFAFWTITVLSVLNGIFAVYNTWTMDINYSGKVIFGAIVFTILVVELTFALVLGSGSMEETYYD